VPSLTVIARPAMRPAAGALRQTGDGTGQLELVERVGDGAAVEAAKALDLWVLHGGSRCVVHGRVRQAAKHRPVPVSAGLR
jgi:hypothetical protein